jgi:quercetin dioxygenase-like cupin family protein
MSAIEKDASTLRVTSTMASEQPWVACAEGIAAKVLAVDERRYYVEFMFKIDAGPKTPVHRHTCETSLFILEGRLKNHTTGLEYGPGDFCYQPYNDEHIEEFVEDSIIYGHWSGNQNTLVEFLDENGAVTEEFKVSDFAAMLPQ